MPNNKLSLAVAGSRKTQSIVDQCGQVGRENKVLIVTFTQANQEEIKSRLSTNAGGSGNITVLGWYGFLINDFAKPFVPFKFKGRRVEGFNFEGNPSRYARGERRFFDSQGAVYACELARLSYELMGLSAGALVNRLECIYDYIFIDEVQDLSGYDWEIIDELLSSSINIDMVGDVRQAVLSTNPRGRKNKGYAYAEAIHWFREKERQGVLEIEERNVTYRCRPEIASFSDKIFGNELDFPSTFSENHFETGHDGIFTIRPDQVEEYVRRYNPQCLRYSSASGKTLGLEFLNFKACGSFQPSCPNRFH
ncbi:UvrD/REP helicase N-terminal domain-containing protein [Onishia taeanensis]|uniref:DNA 3'-5' helicase II n=1 Tax=Onishia taeanensis TaxID=284577 RepID=A0A328XE28_9GAMM|nr:UvrD-helicase domain-containing protein [Halomonas taeanensis]RAR57016.1 UvrD/REP helicase N-terminal domain-containing protein [Halomonas taeanensis]